MKERGQYVSLVIMFLMIILPEQSYLSASSNPMGA